jgi:hypothetical protein
VFLVQELAGYVEGILKKISKEYLREKKRDVSSVVLDVFFP